MKHILFVLFFVCSAVLATAQTDSTAFMRKLCQLPGVSHVTPVSNTVFPEKYVVSVQQYVNGENDDDGTFNQRVVVGYVGEDRPTVIVTEGYYADYALSPYYQEELCQLFDANMVFCEYRYFGPSTPEPRNWDFMTVENSLHDLHRVNTTFKQLFHGKWISTGVSKGGQTTMFYRAYYPEDVDVSVSYVAPLNRAVEDGRHEKFLAKKVGTKQERRVIRRAQRQLMMRKERLMPLFRALCEELQLSFRLPLADIYDYCVLEYPFALWQWGTPVADIPADDASDSSWFTNLVTISDPDYFSQPNKYLPFDVQAARELGYYGYDLKPIKKWTSLKSTKGYLKDIMLTEETEDIGFSDELYKHTVKYLKENDPRHIFIYGEIDPWSASGVAGWLKCDKKENMRVYVQPRGSHVARIGNMPPVMKMQIMQRLNSWME